MNLKDNNSSVNFNEKYPLFTCMYPNFNEINSLLEQAIRTNGDEKKNETNVKALMTCWYMWGEDKPGCESFREICAFACKVAVENSPIKAWSPSVTHCWGAIFNKNEYAQQHNHWPSLWSFTYYVKAPENCAPIVFPGAEKRVQPKSGMLCLFPGWVDHCVPRHESDQDRIVVAGNISNATV